MKCYSLYRDSDGKLIERSFTRGGFYGMLADHGVSVPEIRKAWDWAKLADMFDGECPLGRYTVTVENAPCPNGEVAEQVRRSSMLRANAEELVEVIAEWGNSGHAYLSSATEYSRGYKDGIMRAKEIVAGILKKYTTEE